MNTRKLWSRTLIAVGGIGMLVGLSLATAGCRTFNYTDEDMERERKLIADRVAGGQGLWALFAEGDNPRGGYGGIGHFRLDLGKNLCPIQTGAGICPGK